MASQFYLTTTEDYNKYLLNKELIENVKYQIECQYHIEEAQKQDVECDEITITLTKSLEKFYRSLFNRNKKEALRYYRKCSKLTKERLEKFREIRKDKSRYSIAVRNREIEDVTLKNLTKDNKIFEEKSKRLMSKCFR